MEGKHTFLYSVIVVLRGTCSGKKKGEGDPSTLTSLVLPPLRQQQVPSLCIVL